MAAQFDDEALALLSDAEREALNFDTGAGNKEDLEALLNDNENDDIPPGNGASDTPPADNSNTPPATLPAVDLPDPAAFDNDIAATQAEIDDLRAKFEDIDSELTLEDYETKRAELTNKLIDLNREKVKAEVTVETHKNEAVKAWQNHVASFLDCAKSQEGIDYRGSDVLYDALDAQVKKVAAANTDKPDEWVLAQAHEDIKKAFNLGQQVPSKDAKPKDPVQAELDKRRAAGGQPAPTLGNLPEAGNDDGAGEFAHLNGLKGMALEDALARMPEEKVNRYLMGA